MPSRIIREGINSSERVDKLSAGAEILYRRMLNVVDDFGRFYAHPSLVWSATFPLRAEKFNSADVLRLLAECVEVGLLTVSSISSTKYLEIKDFRQQIRAEKSKFPSPCEATAKQLRANALVGVGVGVGVFEVVGASPTPPVAIQEPTKKICKQKSTSIHPPGFLRFWAAYPNTIRRSNKAGCAVKWDRHGLEEMADTIVSHVEVCARSDEWRRGYEPGIEKYLNQRLWESTPPSEKGNQNGTNQAGGYQTSADVRRAAKAATEYPENLTA